MSARHRVVLRAWSSTKALVTKRLIATSAILVAFAVAAWGRSVATDQDAVIAVDPTKTYQTMKGWEASARLWEQDKERDRYDPSWRDHQDEIFRRLVNELGIDRIRIHLKSGAENPTDYWTPFETQRIGYREFKRHRSEKINDNDDPHLANTSGFQFSELDHQVKILLRIKPLVEANGEKIFINLTYVDFKGTKEKGNISHARQPEEYAELIAVAFEHLKKAHGIVPDALEIILEPDNTDHWRGPQIGAGIVAVVRRLNQAGFSPEIIAPSTASARVSLDYFDQAMTVPGAAKSITTFAYHRYYDSAIVIDKVLPGIAERARRFGLDTAMLEHLEGDVAQLHDDLTRANVSSWQQWAIATKSLKSANSGGYYYWVDFNGPDKPVVHMAPRTRELAQYFRFVRRGAVRISTTSNDADKKAVAFKNRDGMHVAIVQAHRPGTISVVGLPAGAYGVRYTTAAETGRDLPVINIDTGQPLSARLPAKGVITFQQK
jgi:O-glycosyl hydrolase